MQSKIRSSLFGAALGLSMLVSPVSPAWAQEQNPAPTMPMGVTSVTVEGNFVRIVGVDANGGPLVLLLDMRQMTTTQLQALGLPACIDPAAPCMTGNQARGTGLPADDANANVAVGTTPGGGAVAGGPGTTPVGGAIDGNPGPGFLPGGLPDLGTIDVGINTPGGGGGLPFDLDGGASADTGSDSGSGSILDVDVSAGAGGPGAGNGGAGSGNGSILDVDASASASDPTATGAAPARAACSISMRALRRTTRTAAAASWTWTPAARRTPRPPRVAPAPAASWTWTPAPRRTTPATVATSSTWTPARPPAIRLPRAPARSPAPSMSA